MTAYHDLDAPGTMRDDAARVGAHLPPVAAAAAYTDVYAAWPADLPKREIVVSEAARRLADALHLSLD